MAVWYKEDAAVADCEVLTGEFDMALTTFLEPGKWKKFTLSELEKGVEREEVVWKFE